MTTKHVAIPMQFTPYLFAEHVRAACRELDLQYAEVDEIGGLANGTISRYASGANGNPKMSTFLGICNALDLDPRKYFVLSS